MNQNAAIDPADSKRRVYNRNKRYTRRYFTPLSHFILGDRHRAVLFRERNLSYVESVAQ
jgi:hypothetical protein